MFKNATELINKYTKIVIIQGENPDGDSLASSLALEDILEERGKSVTMYCAVDMPKYLRYMSGWDRVVSDFPFDSELVIIVDTSAESLIEKTMSSASVRSFMESHPVVVLDHHGREGEDSDNDLSFDHEFVLSPTAAATGELIYNFAKYNDWTITASGATALYCSIASDTLGLTTESATKDTYQVVADIVALGAKPNEIESARREFMKKPAEILSYKADLINRIEYYLDGELATVHIPWEDIQEYSDKYNPSVLVIDEMRLVDTVKVACAIKTYPDGKLTGKLRCNIPIADHIAGYFGGGGHSYASGFKVREDLDTIMQELVKATDKALREYNDA